MSRVSNEPHSYADYDFDYQKKLRQEWRKINPYFRGRPDYDTSEWLVAEKAPVFILVGIAAFLVWIIAALLKLMIKASWAVAAWIIGALCFIGKWAFLVCAAIVIIIYVANFIKRVHDRNN